MPSYLLRAATVFYFFLCCLCQRVVATTVSVRLIKARSSRCRQQPSLVFLSAASDYHLAEKPWYKGENDWEVFFEISTDRVPLSLEKMTLIAPGVDIARASGERFFLILFKDNKPAYGTSNGG